MMYKETKVILGISRHLLLETSLTEKQIAKVLYISETTMRQIYIKHLGLPPKRYIRRVKMKKAQTLLRISKQTISEIAYNVGYINTSKFTDAFKKLYGITPSEYRKKAVLE